MPPRSSGRVLRSVPFGALPTAVRRQSTTTASCIFPSLTSSAEKPRRPLPHSRGPAFPSRARQPAVFGFSHILPLLVSHRLPGFEHSLHTLLGLGLSAQTQECFPLQIQQILFGYQRLARKPAADRK